MTDSHFIELLNPLSLIPSNINVQALVIDRVRKQEVDSEDGSSAEYLINPGESIEIALDHYYEYPVFYLVLEEKPDGSLRALESFDIDKALASNLVFVLLTHKQDENGLLVLHCTASKGDGVLAENSLWSKTQCHHEFSTEDEQGDVRCWKCFHTQASLRKRHKGFANAEGLTVARYHLNPRDGDSEILCKYKWDGRLTYWVQSENDTLKSVSDSKADMAPGDRVFICHQNYNPDTGLVERTLGSGRDCIEAEENLARETLGLDTSLPIEAFINGCGVVIAKNSLNVDSKDDEKECRRLWRTKVLYKKEDGRFVVGTRFPTKANPTSFVPFSGTGNTFEEAEESMYQQTLGANLKSEELPFKVQRSSEVSQ